MLINKSFKHNVKSIDGYFKFRYHQILLTAIFLFLSLNSGDICQAQVKIDINSGLGIPGGYFKMTGNLSASANFAQKYGITPQLTLHDTYSHKKEKDWLQPTWPYPEEEIRGKIYSNTFSLYALGNKEINLFNSYVKPFISAGIGFHLIYSWTDYKTHQNNRSKTNYSTKAHGFIGFRFTNGSDIFYLYLMGRATFPSDIVFDSFYLGLGFFP
jgi:hypothetical protein